jgi:carboxyl-terminal processing protease
MNIKMKLIALLVAVSLVTGTGGLYVGMQMASNDQPLTNNEDSVKDNTDDEPDEPISGDQEELSDDIKKIQKIFSMISDRYVEGVSKDELIEGAIRGMVDTLGDPYTSYFDVKEAQQFEESLGSSFEGIGAQVSMVNGKIMIVLPFKDSPADKAGLKPNDQIISVDGVSTEGKTLTEVVLEIRGKKGTPVKLGIVRQGASEPLTIEVIRDTIPLETVKTAKYDLNGKTIGVLEVSSFSKSTSSEFRKALRQLEKEGMDGLIIDVRSNPGGLLSAVQDMLNHFITDDKPILQIEHRDGKRDEVYTTLKDKKPYRIITLINERSASASEILAGAMKEAGGYDLVGVKTFGKGTVQQALSIGDGSQLKLTLYKWLTPDGNWIHKDGIEPTVEVKQPEYFYTNRLFVEEQLTFDMFDEQVKSVQEMLKGLGFNPGRTDGYFSEQTELAVKAFQRMNNIEPTGIVNGITAGQIEEAIIERIRDPQFDYQLQAALQLITK